MAVEVVAEINGVKALVPYTTDSGQGLPLGAWTSFEDDKPRNGYLKAGTTFNQSDYPALYNMLGTNVVPDKGYGLDWDNAQSITLSTSDYTFTKPGWFITDFLGPGSAQCELRMHNKRVSTSYASSTSYGQYQTEVSVGDTVKFTVTPGYQFTYFVPYLHPMFIKAVIGPIEDSAADQVVQNINNSRSYSTEEVNTGEKWIDGKPIYKKTWYSPTNWADNTVLGNIDNLDTFIKAVSTSQYSDGAWYTNYEISGTSNFASVLANGDVMVHRIGGFANNLKAHVTVKYTKTTDQATV